MHKARMMVLNSLMLEDIRIPSNSVLFSHGYMQFPQPGWKDKHDIQLYVYLIEGQNVLNGEISFAYRQSFLPENLLV